MVEEAEIMGRKSPLADAGKMRLVFHKEKVKWQFDTSTGEKSFDVVYKVDPKKEPKEMGLVALASGFRVTRPAGFPGFLQEP